MGSISLKNLRLGFANIAYKPTDKDAEATKAVPRFKIENNVRTDVLDGFAVDIIGVKGAEQTVKLPLTAKKAVEEIQKLLADGKTTVRVRFIGFSAKAYSLAREGQNLSGVSCSANDVEITSTEAAEDELDIEIDL